VDWVAGIALINMNLFLNRGVAYYLRQEKTTIIIYPNQILSYNILQWDHYDFY
jgi:hypothetical protein